jgi:hypothetical protein
MPCCSGFVLANSIAKQLYGTGKADRGQSLLFHEFMQSWVGYELVKVLVMFGLQTVDLSDSLKEWSSDLYDVFSYMQTGKAELKDSTTQILDVLFNDTLHSGHWSNVQFGTKQKFLQQNNTTLSLVILTWLQQLQQFFLNKNTDKTGDWNIFGKYCGPTQNLLKNTAQLANINFSKYSTQNNLTQITQVKQFKPFEEKKGVCTSLEEWALCILQPNKEFQMKVLHVTDPETAQLQDRVTGKKCTTFKITENDFTISNTDSDTGNNDIKGLDTEANRHEGQSNQELALIVHSALIKLLEKATKRKTQPKQISPKELANMKKTYDTASAFTAMVN